MIMEELKAKQDELSILNGVFICFIRVKP